MKFDTRRFVGFVASARHGGKLESFGIERGTTVEDTLKAMALLGIDADSITALGAVTDPISKAKGQPLGWSGSNGIMDAWQAIEQSIPEGYTVRDIALDLTSCIVKSDIAEGSYFRVLLGPGLKPADRSKWIEVEESSEFVAKAKRVYRRHKQTGRFISANESGSAIKKAEVVWTDRTPRAALTGKGRGTWTPA